MALASEAKALFQSTGDSLVMGSVASGEAKRSSMPMTFAAGGVLSCVSDDQGRLVEGARADHDADVLCGLDRSDGLVQDDEIVVSRLPALVCCCHIWSGLASQPFKTAGNALELTPTVPVQLVDHQHALGNEAALRNVHGVGVALLDEVDLFPAKLDGIGPFLS